MAFVAGMAVGRHQWSQQNAIFSLWITKDIVEIQGNSKKTDSFLRSTARMYFSILNDPISYSSLILPYNPPQIERSSKELDKITQELTTLLQPPFENYTSEDITKFVHTRLSRKSVPTFVPLKAEQDAAANP